MNDLIKTLKTEVFLLFFLLFVFLKFLDCFAPFQHVDALALYLTFNKVVVESSWQEMINDTNFYYSLTGYFHHLFYIPALVFKRGIPLQGTAQVLHFLFGLGLASFLVFKNIKQKHLKSIAGIGLLTISADSEFLQYAKSDGVVAMLLLVFVIILFNNINQLNQKISLVLGGILGLAIGVKLSALYSVIPLALFFYYQLIRKKEYKLVLLSGFTTLIMISPLLLRNYLVTGNPLFPGLLGVFPGNVPIEMREFFNAHLKLNISDFWSYLSHTKYLFKGKVILYLFPVLIYINFKRQNHLNNQIAFVGLLPFVMYMVLAGGIPYIRFIFPVYFILIYFIFKSLDQLEIDKKWLWLLLVVCLVDSKIDKSVKRTWEFFQLLPATEVEIVRARTYHSQVWERITPNESGKTRILSDYLAESFYAPQNVRLYHYPVNKHAVFLKNCLDVSEIEKFDYAFLSNRINSACTRAIQTQWNLIHTMGEHKVFQKPTEG